MNGPPSIPATAEADDIEALRRLARAALASGDTAGGVTAYRKLLERRPGDVDAHAQLAHALERSHDLVSARTHAEVALAADPQANIARIALARAQVRETDFAGAEATAAPLASSETASANDRAIAWGVIGDARDLSGDAAGAFEAFTRANRIVLDAHRALREDAGQLYHPAGVRAMTAFAAQAEVRKWRRPATFRSPAPAFLVGFPRSGTTLLDQILSSHPSITCLEEKDYLGQALFEVFKRPDQLAGMGALSDYQIELIRSAYWRHAGVTPDGVVIDKLPLNVVVLPLIRAVFPDAKVIVALRDPRDVLLSCYQQRFGMNVAMAQLLELDTAAAYYDAVMGLLEVCRERLGLSLQTVRYEDVVSDLEGQARGLAAFLGLPFDPAMLDYRCTALERDINTPSARQVIQPLYTRSIGRWRRYAEQLAPVLPVLNAWAIRYGYPAA